MKKNNLLFFYIILIIFSAVPALHAFDAITKINLRNSYNEFENCMESSKNDITQCLESFRKVVDTHKKALTVEPGNKDVKEKLLVVLNSMNDIAETYFNAAKNKRGKDPFKAKQYFLKSYTCYNELDKIYSKKPEFAKKAEKAKYFAAYEEAVGYILELQSKADIKDIIYALEKLKKSRNRFYAAYKQNAVLNSQMNTVVGNFFSLIKENSVKISLPGQMTHYLGYILLQTAIVDFDPNEEHQKFLLTMKDMAVGAMKQTTSKLQTDFDTANAAISNQNFKQASQLFEGLLQETEKYPDTSLATPDVIASIKKETNNFSVDAFESKIQKRLELAKTSSEFMDIINSGKAALDEKKYYAAYSKFMDARYFLKEKDVAVDPGTPQKYIDETLALISKLKPAQIDSINLAKLYYNHLSFAEWLKKAESGKFSNEPVYIYGDVQQQVEDVVILKKDTFEYSFLTDAIYQGQKMNNVGVIFNDQRLIREGRNIECIAKYKRLESFTTVLGAEIKIPVFKVIWIK